MVMILDKTKLDVSLDVRRNRAAEASNSANQGTRRLAYGEGAKTVVETSRFGLLEVDPDLVLTFADGIIGFEGCCRYIVVRHQDDSAFRWLQSLDEAHVAFPVVEPGEFCAHYAPTISDADARGLGLTGEIPTLLLAIITIPPRSPRDMTANLLAPLVINGLTRRGKQVIVQDEGFTTRHKIIDEIAARPKKTEETPSNCRR